MSSSVIASRRIGLSALAALCAAAGGLAYTGASASASSLPDGRVFEMVTPVEDSAADVYVPQVVSESATPIGVAGIYTRLPFPGVGGRECGGVCGGCECGWNGGDGSSLG